MINKNFSDRRKDLGLTQAETAKAVGVSRVSISQWEKGITSPKGKNLHALAKVLNCDPDWLLNGQGPFAPKTTEVSNVVAGPELHGLYPVISWVQAGDWSGIHEINAADAIHYPCPVKCSDKTFLLKIQGMSMSPKFNEGDLIFVDPAVEPTNGKYVVARLDDENEATFKQLIIEGGHKFLKAANPAWPTQIQPINGNFTIVGVVIFVGREL
ncbi:LexA family protein [Psychromonas sp. Urea-02u-13]|uniref:LexA family protein n=1 Tax=Psychromonas sp. Urea-02u-13 TaxID=2058326 RepID=UPI000C34C9B3|nr:LexA family transcriptional regulator [Psychromonas sp. Urea-02u-13]PKG37169.1 XRE family transcriptional regulator [Psychromonas sp. Urea-02u-13]